MKRETLIEIIFLAIVFGGMLYLGPGTVFDHQLNHEKPSQYGATDGFLYAMFTEYVYEAGNYRYNPFYSVAGFEDSIAYHPPMLMQLVAAFAHLSGMTAYSALSFILGVFIILSAFIMYWLIRSWNKKVAIFAVPVFFFLYVYNFIIGYVWGEALLLGGTFLLVGLFFLFSKPEIKHWWVPAGLLIAATINTHTSETIFFYGFIAFFFGIKLIFRQLSKKELKFWAKQLALATLLALLLSVNYLVIFYHGYYKLTSESYTEFRIMKPEEAGGIRVPPLTDFRNPVLYTIIIGALITLVLAWRKAQTVLLICGYMFLAGLSNYIGLHYRAFQLRFIWPIYLALFFGITVYFITKKFTKNIIVPVVIALLLCGAIVNAYYQPSQPNTIRDGQWEAFKWIQENTPRYSRTVFLYGDGYSQSLRVVKRQVFLPRPDDLAAMANEGQLRRMIDTDPILASEMYLMYRPSFFKVGYYGKEEWRNVITHNKPMDICGFDYYVLDKVSNYAPQFVQFTTQMANVLAAHNMTLAYQNDEIAILKNNNVGGECLA